MGGRRLPLDDTETPAKPLLIPGAKAGSAEAWPSRAEVSAARARAVSSQARPGLLLFRLPPSSSPPFLCFLCLSLSVSHAFSDIYGH